jgi:phosphoesterase RecJ-like protein
MTQKVKEMAPVIWEAIQKSENVLMHFHPSPDPDTVGSSLTMLQVLEKLGKKATVIKGDSELPLWVNKMPGADKILEKSYQQINPEDYDLFLIMDSSTTGMISNKGEVKFPDSMTTVVIDHHASNTGFGTINLIDPTYIANCEIIYQLIKEWGVELTPGMAKCLMGGLYSDSGGFKYPATNSETFEAATELSKLAPDYTKIIFEIENNESPEKLKYLGLAFSSIETYFNDKVAISVVPYAKLKENNIDAEFTQRSPVSTFLRSIKDWDLVMSLTESEPGISHVSIRTRDAKIYDLSKLASSMGGGGHVGAAGALIKKPFDEAKKYLLEKLAETYPELGQP